jgi:HAD superfamily hydrolase (TIGR01509 family)
MAEICKNSGYLMKKTIDIRDKVLLFDFDGTVVETEILAKEVIEDYFLEKKLPESEHFSNLIVGKTWKLAVEQMQAEASRLGFVLGETSALSDEFRRRYQERFQKGVRLIPGFLELLPAFRKHARFMGIVTGSEPHEVSAILGSHHIQGSFDRVWGFGDYEASKPDPSPYLTAMAALKVTPDQVLVFEDSRAGMESAFRAGLSWVQITHEPHAREPDPRSLLVVRDWREIQIIGHTE